MAADRARQRSALRWILLAFSLSVVAVQAGLAAQAQKPTPPSLSEILDKAAVYCRLFQNASLHYVCIEDVRETIYMPYRIVDGSAPRHVDYLRHHFAYDYQLIRNGKEVSEQRNPLDDRAGAGRREAPPRMGRFTYQQVILGPVIFGEDRQQHYEYKIKGRGKAGKVECVIVEATPQPSAPPGDLFGRAWIAEHDGRILRLEWNQESLQNYESFVKTGEALSAKPEIRLSMEFLTEKNGIAFPSRFRISEEYLSAGGGIRFVVSETTVTYRDYKFFTVESEVSTNDRR